MADNMTGDKTHKKIACAQRRYEVSEKDLPLSCPTKDMEVWNAHPRVFLPIEEAGEVRCPYCSAVFILKGHHEA